MRLRTSVGGIESLKSGQLCESICMGSLFHADTPVHIIGGDLWLLTIFVLAKLSKYCAVCAVQDMGFSLFD